jgi:hypothetical protein
MEPVGEFVCPRGLEPIAQRGIKVNLHDLKFPHRGQQADDKGNAPYLVAAVRCMIPIFRFLRITSTEWLRPRTFPWPSMGAEFARANLVGEGGLEPP